MGSDDIRAKIELLSQEHRDLDAAIASLVGSASADQLRLARLKKRKLRLRDEIVQLGNQLIPDILA